MIQRERERERERGGGGGGVQGMHIASSLQSKFNAFG